MIINLELIKKNIINVYEAINNINKILLDYNISQSNDQIIKTIIGVISKIVDIDNNYWVLDQCLDIIFKITKLTNIKADNLVTLYFKINKSMSNMYLCHEKQLLYLTKRSIIDSAIFNNNYLINKTISSPLFK